MKPSVLVTSDLPESFKEQIMREQATPEAQNRAWEKVLAREVFMEQELATSDEPLKIKDLIKQRDAELKTTISVKEWALFNIGA
jgi:hypothetical protein